MRLNIVTPTKKILTDAEVDEVTVPAYKGELGVLPGHAPLISTLETGILKYRLRGEAKTQKVAISWGYIEITPTSVNILSETAEEPYEINLSRVTKAIEGVESRLASPDLSPKEMEKLHRKLKRGYVRKELAEGKK